MAVGGLVKLKAGEGGSYRTKWPTCRVEWGENQPEMRSQGQIELSTISNGSTIFSITIFVTAQVRWGLANGRKTQ